MSITTTALTHSPELFDSTVEDRSGPQSLGPRGPGLLKSIEDILKGLRIPGWKSPRPANNLCEVERSIGVWYRTIGRLQCWELRGPLQAEYLSLAREIKDHLKHHGEAVTATVIWSAYMAGKSKATAKPTVFFCSSAPSVRRRVKEEIHTSGILLGYPAFRTAESNRPPHLNDVRQLSGVRPSGWGTVPWPSRSKFYACPIGNSILIKQTGTENKLLATIGMTIESRNKLYMSTIDHAFTGDVLWEAQDDVSFECYLDDEDTCSVCSALDLDSNDATSACEPIASGSPTSFPEDMVPGAEEAAPHSRMTGKGVSQKGQGVPQEEQAASRKEQGVFFSDCFGLIDVAFASSHESIEKAGDAQPLLDYCLLMLPLERYYWQEPLGLVALREYLAAQPTRCALHAPDQSGVVAHTGARKTNYGISSSTPTFVTLAGATSTQELWSVRFDRELVRKLMEGDCGSIVVEELSRKLLGHIVAGSPSTGDALVVPAYLVLNDIKQRWDSSVALAGALSRPCNEAAESLANSGDGGRFIRRFTTARLMLLALALINHYYGRSQSCKTLLLDHADDFLSLHGAGLLGIAAGVIIIGEAIFIGH